MYRRQFLSVLGSGIAVGSANALELLSANSAEYKFPEILGLKEPQLCGEGYQLVNEVAEAFNEMAFEANKDGLKIWCASGYRSFNYQKNLWNAKYDYYRSKGYKDKDTVGEIIKYSAIPSTSRHHWGTDLDIVDASGYKLKNSLKQEHFNEGGEYQFLRYWLKINAEKFNFHLVYTDNASRTGFRFEPWHYSYKPLALKMLPQLLEVEILKIVEIRKCKGSNNFNPDFMKIYIRDYILGINPELLPA